MKFSIIIPAYNEQDGIGESIKALQNQTVPRNEYEIIVVDNNSQDNTVLTAKKAGADKVVVETKQGTNMARQRGFIEAQGDIVVFLDADSEPQNDWLKEIEETLLPKDVVAVSGPFEYSFSGFQKISENLYSRYVLTHIGDILFFLFRKKAGVIIGGNFAVEKNALNSIGGLPPLAFWGDDAATAMLLSRRVGRVVFNPDLRVKSSPRRFERDGFLRLSLHYALTYFKIYFSKEFK